MKQVLFTVIILMISVVIDISAQSKRDEQKKVTLKTQMEALHDKFGVNFVYDSSINLDIPCSVPETDKEKDLEEYLKSLFKDTGIRFEIRKKYIVLTRKDSKSRNYTVFIEEQQDTLDESRITAYVEKDRNTTQTGLKNIDGSRFRKGFAVMSSPDVIKELQNLPGVAGGTELLSGLYVHGGDGTDNLFLLDGVPLYQVSHLAGLVSSFNTEMIDNLDFYKSGFPSRYGGKLSSVADITTRTGNFNEYHGSFNIGLLNGGIQFEGPIIPGKTSFNIGIRRSWYDLLTIPAVAIYNQTLPYGEKIMFRYAMTDFNTSVTHIFNRDSKLSLNVYAGSDAIRYGFEETPVRYWEGKQYVGQTGWDLKVRWGNILASLNWKRRFSDKLNLNAILYYTCNTSKVGIEDWQWDMGEYDPIISEQRINEANRSRIHDISAKADINWYPSGNHHIRAGGAFIYHLFAAERDIHIGTSDFMLRLDNSCYNLGFSAPEASLYVEDEMKILSWLNANVGLRYVLFGTKDGARHSFEPRAALRFQLWNKGAFKLSYTEMSQFIHNIHALYLDIPMSGWLPSTELVPPMRSRQIAGGIYTELPHDLHLNVEGYWKTLNDINEYCGLSGFYPDIAHWENELMRGKGRSYGAEIEFAWRPEKTEIAAYYTLSWTERLFEGIWHEWYPDRNDCRHKLTINATHRFSERFDMYLAWNIRSGYRSTVPTQTVDDELYYPKPYNYQLPAYHRLDVGFNFRKTTKRGNESVWNLSVYNLYCRMNPIFASYLYDNIDNVLKRYFKHTSVIPIVPSFSYTLRF